MRGLLAALLLLAGAATANEFTTLKGHGGPIMGLAVAPSGQVASASFDNAVGLWDGRHPTWLDGHEAAVIALAFGPDGGLYSGGDDFTLRSWHGGEQRLLGRHEAKITSIAVRADGAELATGSWDATVRLWNPATGANRDLQSPGAGVNAVAYGSDGAIFAATAAGALWRYDGENRLPLVQQGFGINQIVVGDAWVAYGAVDGVTRVVDAQTGAALHDFTLDRRPILAMAHHRASGQIAVGDGHGYIMLIDTAEWRITKDFRAAQHGPVWALAFSPDGNTIYAGGLDDVVYAWPTALLDRFDPGISGERSFLREADTMPNGERQFMRKCSICHDVTAGPSRKAGPTLHGVFGRPAGSVPGYRYSNTLTGTGLIWTEATIDALFHEGPDNYIPGSKMPMQVIAGPEDRADLIAYLKTATMEETKP
ncbi:MAG: c-type cytochrome [Pseudomonadota bacterium]